MCAMNPRLLRPLATGFNPRQIAGLGLWLDAADASTITLNGSTVSQWVDKSATASVFSQGTAANQPSLSSLNGKNVLESDGTKLMTGSAESLAITNGLSSATLFLVGSTVSYDATARYSFSLSQASSASARLGFGSWSTVSGKFLTFRPDGASFASLAYSHNANSEINTAIWNASAPGSEVWRNGTSANTFVAQGVSMPASNSQGVSVFGFHNGTGLIAGTVAEILVFSRALTASERQRVEGYLAWKWGLEAQLPSNHPYAYSFPGFGSQPRPSNADALDWESAVYSNSGSVSVGTLAAVNTFANAIDAAGIRDRFYRLNLFCGDSDASLIAPRVPLYRGPSRTGTQYGNTLDTNNNFVQGDYAETGASGGLVGNGSTKYLATGLIPFNSGITEQNYHNSGYFPATLNTTGDWIGASGTRFSIFFPAFSTFGMYARFGGSSNSGLENATLAARSGHLIGSRAGGAGVGYRNGVNLNSGNNTTGSVAFATDQPPALNVFARNNNGSPASYWSGRACMYSIGVEFTDSQALAFYNAVEAFQAVLGRQE